MNNCYKKQIFDNEMIKHAIEIAITENDKLYEYARGAFWVDFDALMSALENIAPAGMKFNECRAWDIVNSREMSDIITDAALLMH